MPPLPKVVSTAVYKRDGFRCRHCNDRNGLHPHHVVYQSHGGPDTLDNLITLCWQCHAAHHENKLEIIPVSQTETNIVVRFVRKRGWKPK